MNKQEAKKLETKVLKNIPKGKLILGLSGGPDSVFLLHILRNHDLIAAHLNHKIRKAADADEKFVKSLCENLEIPLETSQVDIKAKSKSSKRGLEECGRIERYKFFNKLAKKHKTKTIITAHHADDNLETILMNLVRGGSLKALAGMCLEEKFKEHILQRPLLYTSKKEILAYLKLHKIPYCKDLSNLDTTFTRNNLRHKIIPQLSKINPNLPSTIAKNHENLAEISDYLEKESEKWLKKFPKNTFPAKEFTKLHPALQKSILITLHKIHIGNTTNLESIHIKDAITLIHNNIGNKKKRMGKLSLYIQNAWISLENIDKKVQY